jgi:hypothetical protein
MGKIRPDRGVHNYGNDLHDICKMFVEAMRGAFGRGKKVQLTSCAAIGYRNSFRMRCLEYRMLVARRGSGGTMRRLIATAVGALLALLILAVPGAKADDGGSGLFFDGPSTMPGGSLLYNGSATGDLTGARIPITSIGLGGGPSDAVSGLSCGGSSCGWLQFTTGSLASYTTGSYVFNGGGMLSVIGTVPGQSGPATTLVSAVFVGPVTVTQISGSTWQLVGTISVTGASSAVTQLFPNLQLPSSGTLSNVVIMFNMRPSGTFSGTAEGSNVFVSTAPEASSLILLGSGLVGVGGFLRRRRRASKA